MEWFSLTLPFLDSAINKLPIRLAAMCSRLGVLAEGAALFARNNGDTQTLYFTAAAARMLKNDLRGHELVPCGTPKIGPVDESIGLQGVLYYSAGDKSVWSEIEGS